MQRGILRLGHFPAVGLAEIRRSEFLIGLRSLRSRLLILWPNRAPAEYQSGDQRYRNETIFWRSINVMAPIFRSKSTVISRSFQMSAHPRFASGVDAYDLGCLLAHRKRRRSRYK